MSSDILVTSTSRRFEKFLKFWKRALCAEVRFWVGTWRVKHFESQNGLRMHCKKFHAEQLSCSTCKLVCFSSALLDQHRETAHNVKCFLCQDCNRPFTRPDDVKRHHRNNCPKNPNRVIKCKHCINQGVNPDVEGAERGLMNHLIGDHGMYGDLLCIFCHRVWCRKKTQQSSPKMFKK